METNEIVLSPEASKLCLELAQQRTFIDSQIRALAVGAGMVGNFRVETLEAGIVKLISENSAGPASLPSI